MFLLVTYDIDTRDKAGTGRLHRVAKACERIGKRVQSSVFEMILDPRELDEFKHTISMLIDHEHDSVRFYRLGHKAEERVTTLGNTDPPHPLGLMTV